MPQSLPTGMRVGIVEPRDAIAAFEQRELLEPSFQWQDVWQDEHTRAFAVAGVMRLDVLKVFRDELDGAIREGRSLEQFRAEIRPRLARAGFWGDVEVTDPDSGEIRTTRFNDRRLRLIYDVNLRQSHAAGRWARIERTKARFPFVLYRTMQDERVRASHRPWDGVVLAVDHPFWNTHYPPCGWRCRCTAFAVDARDIARRRAAGQLVKTEAPDVQWITYVNPSTGEAVPVPRGIDPGFAYNPGKARDAAFFDQALRKAVVASPIAAASVVAQATRDFPAMVSQATRHFGTWVDQVKQASQSVGEVRHVGALQPRALTALRDRGMEPATAALSVRDVDVLHALRDTKGSTPAALPLNTYRRLPELLARARALLLQRAEQPALLYVVDLVREDGSVAKLVLQLDMKVKLRNEGRRVTVPLNVVRTATVIDPNALRDRTQYELLWGTVE